MNTRQKIESRIRRKVLILDGATGTELQSRGMPYGVSPEIYSVKNRDAIKSVHRGYLDAGADIIYACTFGANRFKLGQYGITDVCGMNRDLAAMAREVAGRKGLVAGDIGPTGRFVEPFGDLGFEDAVACYREQARGLLEGGVDLFVIETMIDIQETRAALIAIREMADVFAIVTMTYDDTGRTLNGTDPLSALITLQSLGANAVGCNCSAGPAEMIPLIARMKPLARVPLVAKPNAGLPRLKEGKTSFDMGPREFAGFARAFVEAGANLLGGCCGTTAEHIRALKESCTGLRPSPAQSGSISALSSHARSLVLDRAAPLTIIGERINPTGKKDLQHELLTGTYSLVGSYARDQVRHGAAVLDVNVGMPGIEEKSILRHAVQKLTLTTDAPLCIDTSRVDAMETALRIYPGRALINSISGEGKSIEERLRIAAFYGSMVILLPIAGSSLPRTSPERRKIIEEIYAKAREYGFTKDDIVVDALTMAVSADGQAALETLKTISWCSSSFGSHTVVGLSNVSFGLPERKWVNASFLAMAIASGLTCAIANPESDELMSVKRAADVLAGKDRDASGFIDHFRKSPDQAPSGPAADIPKSIEERISLAILEGDRDLVPALVDQALGSGMKARTLVDVVMVPAIQKVGELYERKTYFLPQLIASAETMKRGFERLEPRLKEEGTASGNRGRVLLATVKGDIHDIGKNIVGLMLENNGFEVVDIGKDVPPETIIHAAREHQVDIVGLSALMTTTMLGMEDTMRLMRESGLTSELLVGGAVVTSEFAESIGAGYARDGVEAVRVAHRLVEKRRSGKR
ncbi:MAG: homocysteine S-methyltransferase family protein [Desulfobacterota bacterium]|nr:homocysteine S-methyltransferase family protein [Thermodesulfobacteriota bacterium]